MSPRPLLVRIGALGDTLMAAAAARAMAEAVGAPVDVLGRAPWTRACLAGLPWIGEVREWDGRSRPYWCSPEQWRLAAWLRARPAGPVIVADHDGRVRRLIARAVPRATWRDELPPLPDEHQVDSVRRLCALALGRTLPPAVPAVAVDDLERRDAAAFLAGAGVAGPYVCLQLGSSRTTRPGDPARAGDKWWPPERWAAVAAGVRAAIPGVRLVLTGSGAEAQWLPQIAPALGGDAVVVAGRTPLRRLFAVLAGAHSLISTDTGTAHAAAATGCPVCVLFGGTDPRVNAPRGPGAVTVVSGPPGALVEPGEAGWARHHTMDGIDPAAVLRAWEGLRRA